MNNNKGSAGTFFSNIAIEKSAGNVPDVVNAVCIASNEWYAAIGTPIKLTKSFPEKANAKPKVPTAITIIKTLFLVIF